MAIKSRQTRQGGSGLTYHREFSKIYSFIYSFFPRTSQIWNNLPPELKSCANIDTTAVSTIDPEELMSGINIKEPTFLHFINVLKEIFKFTKVQTSYTTLLFVMYYIKMYII